MRSLILAVLVLVPCYSSAGENQWYTQGKFEPSQRLVFTLTNNLAIDRQNAPVVIRREDFSLADVHETWVTVVDPALPPYEGPSEELLRLQGVHQLRAEDNGHAIFHQMDDLDKDGIWDELFFQTDIKAHSEKTIYIYLGENIRGWNKHYTHANIGSYARHLMPFWESENVGWKIWFANALDVYAKRKPVLMSNHLYMENLDGYGVSAINRDWGSDIQSVAGSFGGGAICLFEDPQKPDKVSLPRFTPLKNESSPGSSWNLGQISDTRYAYEVIVNGPVRSMIRIKGMNWNTANGAYAYEQYYTAYARQSYTASRVVFTTFSPGTPDVKMGVGFRKKPEENYFVQEAGIIMRVPILEMKAEDFSKVLDVDLTGPFIMSKAVAKGMIARGHGKIINMCSMMSELGRNTVSAYASAKGGLKMLTRNMATGWARHNIQITGIGPGYIATSQTEPIRVDGHPFNDFIIHRTPAGRWGDPEDLAGTAVFLASKASDFVNGYVVYVDGGILATIGKPANEE